jgi:hypothetical protein
VGNVAPRPWPKGQPHPTRGTRHPWRGSWGTFEDGRSKLSRLARELLAQYCESYRADRPLWVRRLRRAARLEALAEMTIERIGVDPKCTRRAATALEARSESLLARVPAIEDRPLSFAERLSQRVGA